MLKARIATAGVLLAVLLGALFYSPGLLWGGLMLALMLAGAWEWARLCSLPPSFTWVYLAFSAVIALASANYHASLLWYAAAAGFWCLLVPLWLRYKWHAAPWLGGVVGWVVLVPTWLALQSLREAGPWFLLIVMATVWISDTAAYAAGKRFGKHKLAPSISPGKTWEGAAGALIAVAVYAVALVFLVPAGILAPLGRPVWLLPLLVALAVLGILGDLFESLMKRQAGLKDSGTLLPGHGGILDRIDALTSTLPLAALIVVLIQTLQS